MTGSGTSSGMSVFPQTIDSGAFFDKRFLSAKVTSLEAEAESTPDKLRLAIVQFHVMYRLSADMDPGSSNNWLHN
ncbi:hypothetical protein Ahy_B10g104971 isoform C [Arachis hypogaea]|uniref:Uncharacterized protein n=1 Tax=Arachis hypogaea TaxID=3818 RepID=A0A444X6T4_ARAHY|nr:hypothetical protein Ahy_B10g104971 isoform C [Arachis hypogaea]